MGAYFDPAGLIVAGLGVLVVGGELLVRGAASLAAALRISPLVIGLTVVAFGTSAPEFAVGVQSSLTDRTELVLGNTVGSNICNVLFVLGISALIAPLIVSSQLVRLDVPLMIVASFLVFVLGLDGSIGRLDGLVLFGGLIGYVAWSIVASRRESRPVQQEYEKHAGAAAKADVMNVVVQIGLVILGLILLGLGSHWLVRGSADVARLLGVSELMIGLTVVAVGTSLPEVVASVVASLRAERDIAVGNVVGSNMFNLLGVLGLSALVAPRGVDVPAEALQFDIPVMIAVAVACLPIFFTGNLIDRWEGGLFFAYYLAYMVYLILSETQSQITRTFVVIMAGFVIPLTALTLLIGVVRGWRGRTTA